LLFRWPCGGGAWCRPLAAFCFALRRRVCPQTAGGPHPRPLPSRHAMVCRPRLLVWARSRIRAPGSRRGRDPQVVCLRRWRRHPAAWLFAPCAGLTGAAAGRGAVAHSRSRLAARPRAASCLPQTPAPPSGGLAFRALRWTTGRRGRSGRGRASRSRLAAGPRAAGRAGMGVGLCGAIFATRAPALDRLRPGRSSSRGLHGRRGARLARRRRASRGAPPPGRCIRAFGPVQVAWWRRARFPDPR
jgi:hypothetical protein